ncbi:MAG: class I SAM-dependent methyltransferase [Bacteroidetes bacterium]|nr:class I SAM-dependent methyltransferase [Bacteroidota bacterium]MBS1740160.1 class I SAM-dependent methyltransferase [Bacteroidota bacterium]
MDQYTQETKNTVDERFGMKRNGVYYAHQPIYGYRTPFAAGSNISRYMVTKSILNAFSKFSFNSFIDIGGAEGYTANIVRQLFNIPVQSTDLSENACKMAGEIFGIKATPCDIHNLPFNDGEFEAVLCSETIEHVTDFKLAIDELLRITKNILVITVPHETPEIVAENIRNKVPHGHIHYFDVNTLDYLKNIGYDISYEKTLSPFLIVPRVLAESGKKERQSTVYRIYNRLTPFFRKIFGLKTANWLTNIDASLCLITGSYGGITFTITRQSQTLKAAHTSKKFKAQDFTNITVPLHK